MKRNRINDNNEDLTEITPEYYQKNIDNNIPVKKKKRVKKSFAISSAFAAIVACIIVAAIVVSISDKPKEKVWPASADLSLEASADIQKDKASAIASIATSLAGLPEELSKVRTALVIDVRIRDKGCLVTGFDDTIAKVDIFAKTHSAETAKLFINRPTDTHIK